MKIIILGFDGLEYDFATKFDLTHLMQKKYGKSVIPKECYIDTTDPLGNRIYEPWTPLVWSSFLTGRLPNEVGLTKETLRKWQNPILQFFRELSIKLGLKNVPHKGWLFKRMGFKRLGHELKDYRCETIFDYAKTPRFINVPTVDGQWGIKIADKVTSLSQLVDIQWKKYYEIKARTLDALHSNWDLFMSYTRLLDIVGEICYGKTEDMFRAYSEADSFVEEVKKSLDPGIICLIVSDHGIQRLGNTMYGKHSDYGFYSFNIETDWRPHKITDFFPQIIRWLNNEV